MCKVCSPWQGDVIGMWWEVNLYFGVTMQHGFEIQKLKLLSHVKGPIAPVKSLVFRAASFLFMFD